jgi:hypothetical protein
MSKAPATPAPAPAKPRRQRKAKNAFALPERPASAPPVPDFAPVPRQTYRHDGWTPERQRAFIGALADTGCVSRAARMVNMAQVNCYTLRRAPGAEEFRAAWDAALDCGLAQMKDIAFERAIEGELIPVFANGKHMGFRRKRNDALLMFVLRHYGKDAAGKRTTINYFSSRASAGAAADGSGKAAAGAEASATTVTTVITGNASGEDSAARQDRATASIEQFAGVTLDDEAKAEIMAALEACAAREQALEAAYKQHPNAGFEMAAEEDLSESFLPLPQGAREWQGTYEPPVQVEEVELADGEAHWSQIGLEKPDWVVEFEKAAAEKAAED